MASKVSWRTFVRRFFMLGITGFGGPTAHVAQLRRQWVESHDIDGEEFRHAFAAASLLPGPASTQTALWVGWRQRGWLGLLAAGVLFITPSVLLVTLCSTQLQSNSLVGHVVSALARGAATAVPSVAFWSSGRQVQASLQRLRSATSPRREYVTHIAPAIIAGVVGTLWGSLINPAALILVCGLVTLAVERSAPASVAALSVKGGLSAGLVGAALKIGALSFGGGFVIVSMLRADAVTTHHWMSNALFASAVALGQVTPGPVVATVAAVGYFAAGIKGALVASLVAFAPSFFFVGFGAPHFQRLITSKRFQAFFVGAFSAALGLIFASGIALTRGFSAPWEWAVGALCVVVGWWRQPLWLLTIGMSAGLLAWGLH